MISIHQRRIKFVFKFIDNAPFIVIDLNIRILIAKSSFDNNLCAFIVNDMPISKF